MLKGLLKKFAMPSADLENMKTLNGKLKILFTVISFSFLIYFLSHNLQIFTQIRTLALQSFLILLFLNFGNLALLTWIQHSTLKPFLCSLSKIYVFRLIAIGQFSNLIFPSKIGMWVPGIYLKENLGLDYRLFSYGVLLQALVAVVAMVILCGGGVLYLGGQSLLAFVFTIFSSISAYYAYQKYGLPKAMTSLSVGKESYGQLLTAKILWSLFTAHIGILCVYFLRIYLAFIFLHIEIDVLTCAKACISTLVLSSIPFLPGVIGIREASLASVLMVYGYDPATITSALLIERSIQIVATGPVALWGYIKS